MHGGLRFPPLAVALICALAAGTAAHARPDPDDAAAERVALTVAYVESCTWIDDLHRSTCAKIGARLSERNRMLCMPAERRFGDRVAPAYAAYGERYRAVIAANEAKISSTVAKSRSSLERQFAELRGGRVSMLDLESLNRELAGPCRAVETEWLRR